MGVNEILHELKSCLIFKDNNMIPQLSGVENIGGKIKVPAAFRYSLAEE